MGKLLTLISLICRKLQKGKSPEVIADELEEDLELIIQIFDTAKGYAPKYDAEAIYEALHEKGVLLETK